MRDGFRVYDSDTHVLPAAEVLERYVDPGFRPRLAELAPYRVPIRRGEDGAACAARWREAFDKTRKVKVVGRSVQVLVHGFNES